MVIEVNDEVAIALKTLEAQASLQKMPLAHFLDLVIGATPIIHDPINLEEFDAVLKELADSTEAHAPLPGDFSRADIFADHD